MLTQKRCVQHLTPVKIFRPTRVSAVGCEYVDAFLKEIKKESQLAIPKASPITLYQLKDGNEVETDVGDSCINL